MKNLAILTVLSFLIGTVSLSAQIQQTQSVTFETDKQSIFDPNPAVFKADTFRLLQDNGQDASFFVEPVNIDAMIDDPNLGETGFQVLAKFGMDFDMYARYLFNSGSADIDCPVEIKFTKPNDGNYGCNQEMWINTNYALKPGYKMELEEPQAEFAMGTQLNAGFFGGARACFTGICDEDGADIGSPSFLNANSSNFQNYLVEGNYDYLRISSGDGLQLPWDLVPIIPPPPGITPNQYTLPYQIDPAIGAYANISGELDQPFRNFDRADVLMGQAIVDKGSYKFMDVEFDPIQFQEYITHIPLSFSVNVGPVHLDFAVVSVPFIFRNSLYHEFKFEPNVKANLDLGRPMAWREMKGATLIQSGNSQVIENFTVGNDLGLTLPDNDPVSIVPTAKMSNQFTSKLDMVFNPAIAFRLMYGNLKVDGVPATAPPIINQPFGFNEEVPLEAVTNHIFNTTFEMGGFNTATLNPIELHPDMTPPTMVTKNILVYIPDAGGSATINPQDVVLNAFDANGGTIRYLSVSPNTFDCSKLGPNTVTVTIDDSRCNITTATAIVTVVDRTKPTIVCKPATIYLNNAGQATVTPIEVYASSSDNCGIVSFESLSKTAFDCSNIGSANTTVLTVNDGHGNSNSCTATITVVDNIAPTVSCKPATAYLNNVGVVSIPSSEVFLSGADNCNTINLQSLVPNTFSCANIGVNNVVELVVNDGHGNTAACNTVVTVLDKIAPTVVCKAATVDLNASGAGSISTGTVFQSGADNCGVVNQVSVVPSTFGCSNLGANLVVLTVDDSHGNTNTCTATVTVRDLIKPVVICPANVIRPNDLGICGANITYTASATDNCSIASLISVPASGSLFNVGTTAVRYTATDVAGNTATCNFSVTINDTESPKITCPANILRENDLGLCSAVASYADATATDNCAVQNLVRSEGLTPGSAFPVGISYIAYRATDIYGNSSTCSFAVEVLDTEAPKLTCPANLTKPNDFGQCGRHMEIIGSPSQLSDNCGVLLVSSNSPIDFPIGETLVTWTIEDIHNNTSTCAQAVKIFDQDWPVIACPPNIKTTTDEGYCEAIHVEFEAVATDNCPGVLLEYDYPPQSAFPIGYTNIEATATDVYGHQSKCSFQVIIEGRKETCNGIDDDCDGYTDEIQDWSQIVKTTSAHVAQGDQYGHSVAIWGDWAIVGMNEKNQVAGATLGAAFILHRDANDPSDWQEVAQLQHSNQAGEGFGSSVAIGNGWAAVGAPRDNDVNTSAGAVHIFKQNPNNPNDWNWAKTIYSSDANVGDNFGQSLSLNGDNLLVGAPLDDEAADNAGAAYIFGKNMGGNENWGQLKKLIATNAVANDNLGGKVSLDGSNAIAGAVGDDQKGLNAGAAFIFAENQGGANNWGQAAKLVANSGQAGDNFGVSVSISGGYAIVGASMDDDKGPNAGTAFIFQKKLSGWQQSSILFDYNGTANDEFGYAVSIWGDYAVVGARKNDSKALSAGATFIYHREDGGWVLFGQVTDGQGKTNDQFGTAVALYATTLIVGAPFDDEANKADRGSASIFEGLCSPSDEREEIQADNELTSTIATLTLSPNPTSSKTTVMFELPKEQAFMVRLFDMAGRMVFSQEGLGIVGENSLPVSLVGVAPGVYLVDFQTEGMATQRRLVVQE